jgi:nucleoside-diphosphate-sugar epimerase
MATYFITGGAGFLGINLARYLLDRGHRIISYDVVSFDYPERDRIVEVTGDIRDPKTLNESMKGSDIVVHSAAALPLYTPKNIRSTDIDGTRNVCEAALYNGVKRLIHISSTAVYGMSDYIPLRESDRLDAVGEYGKAKIEAEMICTEYRQAGLCIPIVRPKSFIGPERLGIFALFYDWAADGRGFPMIGDGNNRYQLLDVEDLCQAIYLCATVDMVKANDTYNIGAKEFTTLKEDYQAVLDVAGFGKKIRGFPAAPVIWILRVLEMLRLSPLYMWVYETAAKDSIVSIEKAEKVLGFAAQYSNKQALIRNFQWYLQHRDEFRNVSGVSHRVPWKQGILSWAKMLF